MQSKTGEREKVSIGRYYFVLVLDLEECNMMMGEKIGSNIGRHALLASFPVHPPSFPIGLGRGGGAGKLAVYRGGQIQAYSASGSHFILVARQGWVMLQGATDRKQKLINFVD